DREHGAHGGCGSAPEEAEGESDIPQNRHQPSFYGLLGLSNMGQMGFPKHFDGKRFFNPDAAQARGFREFVRWKLTSRPETSPSFISDVKPSTPPRRVEGSGLRVTLVNHS